MWHPAGRGRRGGHLAAMLKWPSVVGAVVAAGAVVGAGAQQAPTDSPQALVARTCVGCHNDRTRSGNLSLASFDVSSAGEHAHVAEKMIPKLRAGQMPPPRSRRPGETAPARPAHPPRAQAGARAA